MTEIIDARIAYYTRGHEQYNFGDYLTEYFCQRLLIEPFVEAEVYRLVGSAISDDLAERDLGKLRPDARLSYWCCGARGPEGLSERFKSQCDFWGVRGPLTRDALGLEPDMPMGDPGFLVPLLYEPKRLENLSGRTACMPHFSGVSRGAELQAQVGAQVLLSPSVSSIEEMEALFDQISSVDFLLTASLHGAILACAFGVSFAFWDYGEVDVPFKWEDICALLGIECAFHSDLTQAQAWWRTQSGKLKQPALMPMLAACPFAVRPAFVRKAIILDAERDHIASPLNIGFDSDEWTTKLRRQNAAQRKSSALDARAASRLAIEELSVFKKQIEKLSEQIPKRQARLSIDFQDTPCIGFSTGQSGRNLLGEGWSSIEEAMPWSLYPFGEIVLPAASGWYGASHFLLKGCLYVPRQPGVQGSRDVTIYLNEAMVYQKTFENGADDLAPIIDMEVPIPPHMRADGEVILRINASEVPNPAAISDSSDTRLLLFAPMTLTVVGH